MRRVNVSFVARSKIKARLLAVVVILIAVACLIEVFFRSFSVGGKLRLPVGKLTPAISLGERHGLILASDGSLWSWGSDFLCWPVLGLGNGTNKSMILRRIGTETNWIQISAGISHNLAVKSDGTLWTWGESVQARQMRLTPISVPIPAAQGNDWKQAAAGGIHSVALKQDGTLWAWGNNWAGSVGIASTNGSAVPVQVGSSSNWVRTWACGLETVAMQSDRSLWYWGENPDAALAKKGQQIQFPTRVSPDTNWVDVGFGERTVLAIKADGTLWAWGQQAHVFTGSDSPFDDVTPTRVSTNSDWSCFSHSCGWWCVGLAKQDGSLWLLDASDAEPNGPRAPYKPLKITRLEPGREHVAFAAGAVHAAAPGVHGPIGVILTRDGEVWTWGMVLGDPPTGMSRLLVPAVKLANSLGLRIQPPNPPPLYREKPWQLRID